MTRARPSCRTHISLVASLGATGKNATCLLSLPRKKVDGPFGPSNQAAKGTLKKQNHTHKHTHAHTHTHVDIGPSNDIEQIGMFAS